MTTKLIKINGKKVLCRALEENTKLRYGDRSVLTGSIESPFAIRSQWWGDAAKNYNDRISTAYRPIPKKPRKVKEPESIIGSLRRKSEGCKISVAAPNLEQFFIDHSRGRQFMRITITAHKLRRKK